MDRFVGAVLALGLCVSQATECPSSTLSISVNSTPTIFSSPGFPDNYARPLSCKWLFTAAGGSVVNFRILTFDVFPSIFCYRDVFDIFDGAIKYSAVLQSWCGGRPAGQTYKTSTPDALVTFQAVTVGEARQGFEFEVWAEIEHIPGMGTAELGPVHLVLLVVFAFISLVIVVFVVTIVVKEIQEKRLRDAEDD